MNHEIVLLATCKLIAANMRVIASAQYLFCCGYCQPENKGMCIIKWVIIIITEVRKAPHHPLEYNT